MLQTADVISELKKLIIKSEKPYDLDAVDRAITAACKAHEGQDVYKRQELLAKGGFYAQLYNSQFENTEEAG